jgi:hypothetical protein
MPKIPTFTTQARPTEEVGGVKSTVQAPMPTFAGDLQKSIAKYYVAEKQEEAKIKSVEYENKSWNGLYDIIEKHSNNPYPSEASSGYLNDIEQYKNNFVNTELAGADNFTKKAFLEKFEANTRSGLLAVERQSRTRLDLNKQTQDSQFGSNLSTKIRLNPAFATTASLEANDYVLRNYSDPNVIAEKTKFFNDLISSTKLDMETPEALLDKLKKDPNLYSNIPKQKEAAIKFALNKIEERKEELFTSNISNLVANTPYGQQADFNALLEPQIKQYFTDPKEQAKASNLAENLFNKKRKIINEQGAAEYFIKNNLDIKNQYEQSLTDSTRFKTFTQSLDELFDKQKVPQDLRTYLPTDKVEELKAIINGTPGAEERINIIDNFKSLYGDKMPLINKQINKQVDPGVSLAISTNSKPLRSLAILGPLNDDQKKFVSAKLNSNTAETELIRTVESNISGLSDIIANQPEGYKEYSSYVETTVTAIKNAGMRGLLDNKYSSASEAADKLSEEFLNDYVITNDTFYIPYDVNGKNVAIDFIEAKAKVWEKKLYFNDIDLDNFEVDLIGKGGVPSSKQETIDYFKRNGEWYMDGNTGIKFGVKESFGGFTPMKINKKNVTINFLDYDGEFSSMKDKDGNSYNMSMVDIYRFINAEYEGKQVP